MVEEECLGVRFVNVQHQCPLFNTFVWTEGKGLPGKIGIQTGSLEIDHAMVAARELSRVGIDGIEDSTGTRCQGSSN